MPYRYGAVVEVDAAASATGVPAAATGLAASDVTSTSFTLAWTRPVRATGSRVRIRRGSDIDETTDVGAAETLLVHGLAADDSSRTVGATVTAYNGAGDAPVASLTVTLASATTTTTSTAPGKPGG